MITGKLFVTILTLTIASFGVSAANASTYYFSFSMGDDGRTNAEAQNPASPWKTLDKLNDLFYSLQPGDSVLLKRGDVFTGYIDLSASGTVTMPIVLSAYGPGAKPVINGFANLTNWTSSGNGVWQSDCPSCGPKVNMVTIDGINRHMGRFPNLSQSNKGYLTIESHVGNTQITDNQLPASPTWTNAEIVIRKNRFIIDRHVISSHSGNTINYLQNSSTNYEPTNNFGYFIQNHPNTLDENGEWFYDSAAKKMKLYYQASNPNDVTINVATVDLLLTCYNQSYLVVDGLSFLGANVEAMEIYDAIGLQLKNCDISFVGFDGIYAENLNGFTIENCTISDANNDAIHFAANCSNSIIRNNKIRRTAIYPGSGYSGFSSYQGITFFGDGNLVELNEVDSSGYSAISFIGSNNTIKNNFVKNFGFVKDDAGGIYTSAGQLQSVPITGRKITGNIILNGVGAPAGTNDTLRSLAEGIYTDDDAKNVIITGNTVAYCNHSGLLVHNASELSIKANTFFENTNQWFLQENNNPPVGPIRNLDIKGNILFSKDTTKLLSRIETLKDDVSEFGAFDSNYYCRPSNQNRVIYTRYYSVAFNAIFREYHSLDSWKTKFAEDAASKISPATATDSILFEYNATTTIKTIVLNGRYVDVKNNQFSGTYNIAPYASVILIKKPNNCNASTWIGTANNQWHNPLNWSCGIVPDEETDVTIAAGTPYQCSIALPATARSLTVAAGAVLVTKGLLLTQ